MSLIEALRHHTRAQYEALHQHPLLAGLSDDRLTLDDFHHILLAFDAYYTHAEAACFAGWPEHAPNAPVLAWLASDLAQHRLDSWADRVVFSHPPLDTPSKMAGYLYVKQGFTLGGQTISKHVERQLALIPHIDQWFFAGYHHDNGRQWKLFVEVIDGLDFHREDVVASASQSFENLAWFCDSVVQLRQSSTLETPDPRLQA